LANDELTRKQGDTKFQSTKAAPPWLSG